MDLGVSSVGGWSGGSAIDLVVSRVAGSCFIFLCVPDFADFAVQLRVRCGLGYQRHLMRIRCDCWTISVFGFMILFCSFFIYISSACFWVGIVIG